MSRPNTFRVLIIPVLILVVAMMAACGGNGDEQTLFSKYFMSSKIADNLTLANIATVSFSPTTEGQMLSFSIKNVSQDVVTPLTLKAGAEEIAKAVEAEKEFTKTKTAFYDANAISIERILKAEAKNQNLGGRDLEIQKQWTKWRDDAKAMSQKVSDARKRGNEKRSIVDISITDQRNPVDPTAFDGEITTKDVTIEGKVKPPTGDAVTKTYIFTMERATLKNVNGKDKIGQWVITGRKDAGQ